MKYRTIVADPPWQYRKGPGENGRNAPGSAENHYPTMPVSEIAALPIGEFAAEDAHLYVWVTNPVLTEQRIDMTAMDLVRAWGFEPKTLLTWVKGRELRGTGAGMGWYFRGDTEHVIFAVRGTLGIPAAKRVSNVFAAPVAGRHSAKPDAFLDLVEQVSPGPYLEVFARRARFGWDYWGDESLGTATLQGER